MVCDRYTEETSFAGKESSEKWYTIYFRLRHARWEETKAEEKTAPFAAVGKKKLCCRLSDEHRRHFPHFLSHAETYFKPYLNSIQFD